MAVETARPLEHRQGRLTALLRENRVRLVLAIAAVEGVLVLLNAIPWWAVLFLAATAFVAYAVVGRGHANGAVREGTWIGAVSQLIVVLVPALAALLTALAVVALVLLAAIALWLLLLDRR